MRSGASPICWWTSRRMRRRASGQRRMVRLALVGGAGVAGALLMAACGSSGPGSASSSASSSGATHSKRSTTSTTSAPKSTTTTMGSTTTSGTGGSGSGPMVTASLPVVVCQTSTGVATTTTALPGSVSVSVPPSQAQQGNLAVYTDETGRLMLVGPTVGWTCNGSFGADGSGLLALAPVGTAVPLSGMTWHLPPSSTTQAIVAAESGGSPVQGAALACPFFTAAQAANAADPRQGLCWEQPLPGESREDVDGPGRVRGPAGRGGGGVSLGRSESSQWRGAVPAESQQRRRPTRPPAH